MANYSSVGQALMQIGRDYPGILRQRKQDAVELEQMNRTNSNEDEDRKRKALMDAITYGEAQKKQELGEEARTAYKGFQDDEALLAQSQRITGKDDLSKESYMGPLRPEVMDSLGKMSNQDRFERMKEKDLPFYAGYDPGVKSAVDQATGEKKLNDPYKVAQIESMKTRAEYLQYQMENANPEKRAEIQAELMRLKERLGRETDELIYSRAPKPTYNDLQQDINSETQRATEDTTMEQALSFINDIKNDPAATYGLDPRRLLTAVEGTDEFAWKLKIEQLKEMLTVAERGKLKGQGHISDGETEMLRKSITMLQTGLPEKAFKQELSRVESVLRKVQERKARQAATPTNPVATPVPVSAQSSSEPVQISSDEEFNNLPSGTVFIAPDGKRRRKP
jgi:hypothetical protein